MCEMEVLDSVSSRTSSFVQPAKTTGSPDYSDAVHQGCIFIDSPKDTDRTRALNVLLALMTPLGVPAGS